MNAKKIFPKHQDIDLEDVMEKTITKFAECLNIPDILDNEIYRWRQLRNKIVHDFHDVEFEEAKKAKVEFERIFMEIDPFLVKY